MKTFFTFFTTVLMVTFVGTAVAQSPSGNTPKWGTTKLLIAGGGKVDFVANKDNVNFQAVKFHIMPMAKLSDRMFLLSEIEIETSEGDANFGLEVVNLAYRLAPGLIIHGGRFLPKFGAYRGRYGEGFINRFASDPVGFGDGGIGPMVETGIGLQGGLQLGASRLSYDLYASDGPQLLIGSPDAPDEAGQFDYEAYLDNNKNKAIGGRIGFLPFANSMLEIGVSGEVAGKTGEMNTPFENTSVNMYDVDVEFYHAIKPIKSTLRVLAEWKALNAGNQNYPRFDTTGTYTFDNSSSAYYVTASIRPSESKSKVLRNLELAGRYSSFSRPDNALWGGQITQTTVGIDYWLKWDCVLKVNYRKMDDGTENFVGQLVYRF